MTKGHIAGGIALLTFLCASGNPALAQGASLGKETSQDAANSGKSTGTLASRSVSRSLPRKNTAPASRSGKSDRIPYKKLTWADFQVDDKAPGLSAQTQTFLSYRYTARAIRDPESMTYSATVTKIEFDGGFDREQSWRRSSVRTDNELLLDHEQGHLDINEIKLRQLRSLTLEEFPEGKGKSARSAIEDLDKKLRSLYKWHLDDLEEAQRSYDKETRYGTRRSVQRQWSAKLQDALRDALEVALQQGPDPD